MALTQMRIHITGVQRGVIQDNGQTWAKVHTTEPFEQQGADSVGERACDVSASYGFIDEVAKAGIKLPADVDVMCQISITKTKARLVVQSLAQQQQPKK